MEERIKQRITELEAALEQTIGTANAIRGALAELRLLLMPPAPTLSGDPLEDTPS